jgi:hypothetical protein
MPQNYQTAGDFSMTGQGGVTDIVQGTSSAILKFESYRPPPRTSERLTDKVANEMRCLNASLRAQRSNPCLRTRLDGLLRRKRSSQ